MEQFTQSTEFSSLPPVDRGKDAWLFLAACFTVEALTWGMLYLPLHLYLPYISSLLINIGFPFAFGVFQDFYSTNAPFAGSSQIAIIGTCAMV